MKIKDLFKKVETANEIAKLFNHKYAIRFLYNGDCFKICETYSEFKQFVKEEFSTPWEKALLENFDLEQSMDNDFEQMLKIKNDFWDVDTTFPINFNVVKRY